MLSVQPGVERQFARKKLLVHLDTLRALDASYPSGSAARTAGPPASAASASIPERPAGTAVPSSDAMAAEMEAYRTLVRRLRFRLRAVVRKRSLTHRWDHRRPPRRRGSGRRLLGSVRR